MDIGALLVQAANLMITGMAGVFVFLSILILAMGLLAKFAASTSLQTPQQVSTRGSTASQQGVSKAHVAAISAAVATYRKNNE
ncbi:OadG family protein [Pseudoalteromonas sp. T1lg65]|uniref:OadG family protein n=1 Tax=Pseudoalteromonas sp. T1lg65 TaxID=2077101 RepID=UPI003F793D87